eukprot:TRINITY_DN288_c0_g1_i4.p1 TRINITY_DN288_c0_g1~~TRINITY_DN288_c0_g1_i4.p1  ORF type:complete len:265 (-),score=24.74 TRINITY_DN288_c0_g1_i4:32-826(-)
MAELASVFLMRSRALLLERGKTMSLGSIISIFLGLPCVISCLGLSITNDALISTLLFHVSIFYLPMFWINLSKAKMMRREDLFQKPTLQIFVGFLLGLISCVTVLIFYDVTSQMWPEDYSSINLPFREGNLYLVALGIDFLLINPVLEEIYWNVFLIHLGKESNKAQRHSLMHLFKVSFFFGLYHLFPIWYIFTFRAGVVVCFLMTLIGMFFLAIRLHFGLLAAILTHIGGDLGVGLVFLDLLHAGFFTQNPAITSSSFLSARV